jgi:hypothetical protein
MGNASFWYFPNPTGSQMVTLNLGEPLAELFTDFEVDGRTGVTMSGKMRRVVGLSREVVTIQRDRLAGGERTAMKFAALQSHLDKGGSVSFSADADKAWAAPIKTSPNAGDTRIRTHANPFRSFVGTNTPAANDYVVIESPPPGMIHEIRQINNASSLSATTDGFFDLTGSAPTSDRDSGTAFTYDDLSFARWYRFWPILKRPQADIGKNIITNESGILWSLSVRLVVDYYNLFSFHPATGQSFTPEFVGDTLLPEASLNTDLATLDSPRGASEYGAFDPWWRD